MTSIHRDGPSLSPARPSLRALLGVLALLLAAALPPTRALAVTLTVNDDSDVADETDNVCTLREAIVNASQNSNSTPTTYDDCPAGEVEPTVDLIQFSGVNNITLVGDEIFISDALEINGTVTLDGGGEGRSKRIFRIVGPHDVKFVGLTFQNAWDGGGGAVWNLGGNLIIEGVLFQNNKAISASGGALDLSGGDSAFLDGVTFMDNESLASGGGAIRIGGTSTIVTIKNAVFQDNIAAEGGGAIWMTGSGTTDKTFTIEDTQFLGNESRNTSTTEGGGAIFNSLAYEEPTLIQRCIFDGNTATDGKGGAIYNAATTQNTHFLKNVFIDNEATGTVDQGFGGAIWNQGQMLLDRSTLSANVAALSGGGIGNKATSSNNATIVNTTITGNTATTEDGGGVWNDEAGFLVTRNVTVTLNIAPVGGGANVYNDGELIALNTIIANGLGDASCGPEAITNSNGDGNVQFPGTSCTGNPDPIPSGNPNLGAPVSAGPPAGSLVFPIGTGSAATSAGDETVCSDPPVANLDQRDQTRPQPASTACDSGSYESDRAAGYDSNPSPGSSVPIATDTESTGTGTVTVSETGNDDLFVSNVNVTGDPELTLATPTSFTIQDGGQPVDIEVDCTSTSTGTFTATLEVTHNGGNSPSSYTITCEVTDPPEPGYGSNPAPGTPILLVTTFGIPATANIVVSETGDATLTGNISLVAPPLVSSIELTTPEGPFAIPDGGPSVTITVECSGTSDTQDAALLTVTHDATGSPALYPVSCIIEGPNAPLFASLPLPGTTIALQTAPNDAETTDIQVANLGNGELGVTSVQLAGDPQITLVSPSAFTIGSKGIPKDITLQCVSGSSGDFSTDVTVTHNATGSPATYVVGCNVTGNAIPGYGSNPPKGSTIQIGTSLGNAGTNSIQVSETGTATLNVMNVGLTGDPEITLTSATSFQIADGGLPVDMDLSCSSPFIGQYDALVTVTYNSSGTPATYSVVCNNTATPSPVYTSSPVPGGVLQLATIAGNPDTETVVVSEGGTTLLDVTNVAVTGDPEITLTSGTSFQIPDGGAAQNVSVQCASGSAGTFTGTLTVTHNAAGSPATYPITCDVNAAATPGYGSNPSPGATIPLATTTGNPTNGTITVSETGTALLDVTNVGLSGDAEITLTTASSFQIADGGLSQDIAFSCSSAQVGQFSATLSATHNATGSPATYTITCDVTAAPTPGYGSNPAPGATVPLATTTGAPTSSSIVVSETGSALLDVTNVGLSGDAEITLTTASSFQIADGGQSQNVTVQCSSAAVGQFSSTLTVTHNANGSPATYTITCDVTAAPAPGYGSNPASGATVPLATTTGTPASSSVVVSETGTALLDVTNVGLSGDAEITLTTASSFQIADGGQSQNVTVQCSSAAVGQFSSTLTVTHNANGSPATYTITCDVTAAPAPGYGSNPSPGATVPLATTTGSPTSSSIAVSETGSALLDVTNVGLSGDAAITLTSASSFQIANGGQPQNVTVQCSSAAVGPFSSTLTITHNASGSPATYTITCDVTAAPTPGYGSNPSPGATVPMATTTGNATTASVVVSETGSALLDVTNVGLSGDPEITLTTASSFQIADSAPSKDITVQCSSAAVGQFTSTLTATHNASGSPATYTISCDVTAAPVPGYGSNPAPSAAVPLATTTGNPTSTNIQVSETGSAMLSVTNVQLTGDSQITLTTPTSFQIADGGLPQNIGLQCSSAAVGQFAASLAVTHNAAGSPAMYSITCDVTAAPTPGYGSNPIAGTTVPIATLTGVAGTGSVAVSETGSATLSITNVQLTGSPEITLTSPTSFQIVNGGNAQDVTFQCLSGAAGQFNATLSVTHNAAGSPAQYPIQCDVGSVPAPGYGSNPAPGGMVSLLGNIGVPTAEKVTVSETGTATLSVTNVSLSGAPEITLTSLSSFQILDGGPSQDITFQCVSASAGAFSSTLTVTHNAGGSPATYTLGCKITAPGQDGVAGDFNGDDLADFMLEDSQTGALQVWFMNGANSLQSRPLDPAKTLPQWDVVGSGDFDLDGKEDLVLQHSGTGAMQVWTIRGVHRSSKLNIEPASLNDAKLRVVAVADFNGDGRPDLLRQEAEKARFQVIFLKGASSIGTTKVNPDEKGTMGRTLGAPDLNGDGKADILFDHKGVLGVWFMEGVTRIGTGTLSPSTAPSSKDVVVAQADYDGDGDTDLVFQNKKTRALQIWFMNGITRVGTSATSPAKVGGDFVIVAPR